MRHETLTSLQRNAIWLSLLGHLLLLSSFTALLLYLPHELPPQTSPPSSVPSYLTPSPQTQAAPAVQEQPTPQPAPEPMKQQEQKETAKDGIEKAAPKVEPQKKTPVKTASKSKPKLDPRTVSFSRNAVPENITNPRDQEPLHLIGESKIVQPLIKILARALSRHLMYPRVAADFNLRGIVLVGFVLNPEGYVTEAKVVQSSGAGVLDDAARDAVGAMSPVGDVREYVPESKYLVVGIIFG